MQAAVTICISYVFFFRALSKYPGNRYYLYLLCPLLQGSLKVCRPLLPFVSLMSSSWGLSQSMQATVIIGISYVLFLGTLSEYAGSCYHLYLLCLLPQSYLKVFRLAVTIGISYVLFSGTLSKYSGCRYHLYLLCLLLHSSLKVCRQLLPSVSLMSSSSGLSQSIQATVIIYISYVLFFRALSKYAGCFGAKAAVTNWTQIPKTARRRRRRHRTTLNSQEPAQLTIKACKALSINGNVLQQLYVLLCGDHKPQALQSLQQQQQKGHAFKNRLIKDQGKI